jgi:hypothetical protein
LRDTLAKEQWMIHVCRTVDRLAEHLARSPDLPDDHPISSGDWQSPYTSSWWVPWVMPEWQRERKTTLYVRDIRLAATEVERD